MSPTTFDEAAADYDAQLSQGLAITGEYTVLPSDADPLASCLEAMALSARSADFETGNGTATPYFFVSAYGLVGLNSTDHMGPRLQDYPARFLNLAVSAWEH
jgi:hypothetical protein